MELYLLRHAKAVPRAGRQARLDHERALTPEGETKMWAIAKGMHNLGLTFDLILSSPYVRARQTAEIAAKVLRLASKLTLNAHLAPEGDPRALIAEINEKRQRLGRVLLVGHEPYLSELLGTLAAGSVRLRVTMKKAGLACLTTDALRCGACATLDWLLTPRQLVLLSKV